MVFVLGEGFAQFRCSLLVKCTEFRFISHSGRCGKGRDLELTYGLRVLEGGVEELVMRARFEIK